MKKVHSMKRSYVYGLAKRIKVIVSFKGRKYLLRRFDKKELRDISFLAKIRDNIRELVDESHYTPRSEWDFYCVHKYGFYGDFKPSIEEVIMQIPKNVVGFVRAFEIIELYQTPSANKEAYEKGLIVSKVRLYTVP